MRRREFVASSLGLAAGGAVERLAGGVRGARALALQTDRAAPLGKWIHLSPFPEALEEVGGAAANGKLYVFGGLIPIWKSAGVVYEYDPAANAWTKRTPMPHPLHHPAIATLGGKVYLFGGFVLPDSGPPGWVHRVARRSS